MIKRWAGHKMWKAPVTVALLDAPEQGWRSSPTLALLAAAGALLALFVVVETRVARPMLDLTLFRYPRFVGVQLLPIATAFCYVVLLIFLPGRLIGIENRDALASGAMMVALSAPLLVVPLVAGACARFIAAGVIAAVGLLVAAAGLLWLGEVAPRAPMASSSPR